MSPSRRPTQLHSPEDAVRRHLRVGKADMKAFYAIVESYEGLATLRTVAVDEGIVQVDVAPDMMAPFEQLLDSLSREMVIAEVTAPAAADQ